VQAEKASVAQQLTAAHAQSETLQQKLSSVERELHTLRGGSISPHAIGSPPLAPTYQQGALRLSGSGGIKKVRDTGRVEMSEGVALNLQDQENQPLMDELSAAEKKDSCCSCCTIS
jgi:hypothetical protein